MSKVWRIVLVPHAVRKTQTARVSPPHPPTPSPPPGGEGELRFHGAIETLRLAFYRENNSNALANMSP